MAFPTVFGLGHHNFVCLLVDGVTMKIQHHLCSWADQKFHISWPSTVAKTLSHIDGKKLSTLWKSTVNALDR